MLEIYLPIVQVNIDIFLLLFLSLLVGILSGLFGVGGGFLMTPFLIFMGIPPVYAVPNEVNNILAKILFTSFGTAYTGGMPIKIKKGVIKKPPPTPKRPERIPTNKLKKSNRKMSMLT